jgi:hypothetical protein
VGGIRRDITRSDCSTLVIERSSSSMSAALGRGILQPPGAALQHLAAQRPPMGTRARERAVGQSDQKHRIPHGRCDTRGLCSSRTAATERPRKDAVAAAAAALRHRGCRTTWLPTHGWARSRHERAALLTRLIPAFAEPHALSVKLMRALVNRPLGRGRRRSPNPGLRRNRGSTIDHPHRTTTQPQRIPRPQ